MAIRPDHCHCVVALLFDLAGEDLGVDFLLLDQEGATELVDAGCTAAGDPQGIGVDHLLFAFLLDYHLPLGSIVKNKDTFHLLLQFLDDASREA